MKTDFFITYHHNDELAARWIAGVLKDVPFSILMESWDFLPGNQPLEKIGHMTAIASCALVLLSERFLQSGVDAESWQFLTADDSACHGLRGSTCHVVRIDSCDVEKALGAVTYTDLFGIKEGEARKRLLTAVGAPTADKKETEGLPVTAKNREEVLEKRKAELDELLNTTIKHQYHMKLDLEQEVEKEVEVKNEKTGEIEKRIQWVWETVELETVLKDGHHYILVNPSGMGKTVFLTHVAFVLLDSAGDYPFVPLFNTCIALNNREGSIANFIHQRVESFYNNSQTAVVHGEWENLCILLDALDQARDVDDIVSSLQIHDKYHYYKKAKIILSSRQNTADKVKQGFRKIRLKLPEDDEVRHYLGEENYKNLEGHIAATRELVTVPVLLEMLKTITEKGYDTSKLWNRADLYTEFTRILMDQERSKPRFWQDALSIRHFIDNAMEQALEKIAFFSLVENRILEIEKEKLVKYCKTPEKKEALLNIGIILELFEDREQKIIFRHQSFQAYFAGRYIYNQQPEIFRELIGDIAFFYSDVWYEVMSFFVGLEKDPQKAGQIIDSIKKKFLEVQKPFLKNGAASPTQKDPIGLSRGSLNCSPQLPNPKLCFFSKLLQGFSKKVFGPLRATGGKKTIQEYKEELKIDDLTGALRLIFAVFLTSETWLSIKKVQNLHEQLRVLLTSNIQYLNFILSNIAKLNLGNDDQRKSLFIIFKALLKDEHWDLRHTAAKALVKIVTAQDIPLLEPLLRDEDEDVRFAAANALGDIVTSKDIPLLESLLMDENRYVRWAATRSLGNIVTSQDISLLEPLLKDEDWKVRRTAIDNLGKICSLKDIVLLEPLLMDKVDDIRWATVEVLGKIGTSKDIPLLEPLFIDEDYYVQIAAAEVLGKIGTSKDIPLLEPLFRHCDRDIRCASAEVIGQIGTSTDIPILEPLLRDGDGVVRSVAADALGSILTSINIPLLEPLLRDEDKYIREAAAKALGNIGTSTDVPLLEILLLDIDYHVRSAAAKAVGKMGKSKDIPLLKPLLNDEDLFVRQAAAEAVGNIVTSKDIPPLEPLLIDEDYDVRESAAEIIGKIGNAKGIPILELLLKDNYGRVRQVVAEVIGKIGTSKDISLLEPLLKDDDYSVRQAAAEALGKIGTSKDIILLSHLFSDNIPIVRITASKLIGKIGTSKDIIFLSPLLKDGYDFVQQSAAEVIGKIGTSKDIPLLVPLLEGSSSDARHTAAEAIEQIYKRSTPELRIDDVVAKSEEKETIFVKTVPTQPLHILHISDIHYALEKDPTINCIFHEFLRDIQKWRTQQNNEKIHSICLTGDIAQSGQKNQYESINEKINAILNTTGCSKDHLFIIPGNHDVHDYEDISDKGKTILSEVWKNKMNIDTGVLSNFENYHEFHEKFNHYYEFVETSGYLNSLPLTDKRSNSPKPWYSRKLQDFPVRIIGLNSALFCLKEFSEYGKIRMGAHQFHEAYFQGKPGNIPKDELVILLTHHPLNWLAENEYEDYTTLMERYAIIHLHGHIHRTKIRKLFSIAGSSYISVGTGSLYGEKGLGDINTYHIITLDFKKEEVHIWARRWIPERGCWGVYDNDINNTFPFPGRHY